MYEKFDLAIMSFGFKHNNVDKCLYSKVCGNRVVLVCLYVDDMLIISNQIQSIKEIKRLLSFKFKVKYHGQVDTILSIKLHQD